jgi:hypothetical protein
MMRVDTQARREVEVYETHWNLEKIFDTVQLLRDHWDKRAPNMEFYTLGKTVYLDGNTPAYFDCREGTNPILLKHFGFMYEDLREMLSVVLGEPVIFLRTFALPGFHVFPSDPQFLSMSGSWHVDIPHNTLGLGNQDTQAYTVAIKLPTGGGGMDMRINDKDEYVEYEEGKMYLHPGTDVHRISCYKEYRPDEYRITLQGHIVRNNGELITFW